MGRNRTIDDDELLRVAHEVFRDGGHTATTRDVARAAGISQAVLYQRFGSKEDLFLRAMTPEVPDVEALLGSYPPRSAKDDVRQIAGRLVDFFASMLPTLLHVHAHPNLGASRLKKWHSRLPFMPIVRALSERIGRMQADGLVSPVNAEAAAHTLLAAAHSVALLETMMGRDHGHARAAKIGALTEVIWSGLAPVGESAPARARVKSAVSLRRQRVPTQNR
jgi:AcrR family transcriptional regulator